MGVLNAQNYFFFRILKASVFPLPVQDMRK